jgi:hypothetical protein
MMEPPDLVLLGHLAACLRLRERRGAGKRVRGGGRGGGMRGFQMLWAFSKNCGWGGLGADKTKLKMVCAVVNSLTCFTEHFFGFTSRRGRAASEGCLLHFFKLEFCCD